MTLIEQMSPGTLTSLIIAEVESDSGTWSLKIVKRMLDAIPKYSSNTIFSLISSIIGKFTDTATRDCTRFKLAQMMCAIQHVDINKFEKYFVFYQSALLQSCDGAIEHTLEAATAKLINHLPTKYSPDTCPEATPSARCRRAHKLDLELHSPHEYCALLPAQANTPLQNVAKKLGMALFHLHAGQSTFLHEEATIALIYRLPR
jgi:hypothetical protein